jgi:hypothetical protein
MMGLFSKVSAWWRYHQRTGEEIRRHILNDVMSFDECWAWQNMTPAQKHKFEMSFLKKFRKDPVAFARAYPTFYPYVPEHLKSKVYG